jgi:hypothetical protein
VFAITSVSGAGGIHLHQQLLLLQLSTGLMINARDSPRFAYTLPYIITYPRPKGDYLRHKEHFHKRDASGSAIIPTGMECDY